MKAIYGHKLYHVSGDNGKGIFLSPIDSDSNNEIFYVGFESPGLIVDPTDLDILDFVENIHFKIDNPPTS